MAKVIITKRLDEEINKKFKKDSITIFKLIYSLKDNPKKGKPVGNVGSIVIKELKYESFRFYFITDGYRVKFLQIQELNDLLIRFVAMSDKKDQQKVIEEIKHVLRNLGSEGFS
ncbi:hypothetical protein J4218_02150 [Candidatus Pacearchaeota archaeon]|nr:hypothetical protein [uncultured archaeon]AQS29156.1 hypothetical protein [uncultured archaeon]MBS3078900.1 hypothetical protein [Candidatus Pacearchaeota archaeon]